MAENDRLQLAVLEKKPFFQRFIAGIKEHYTAYLLIAPIVIALTVVLYFPGIFGIRLTFERFNEFVGLQNYQWVLTNDLFHYSLGITLLFLVSTIALQLIIGGGIALIINRLMRIQAFWTALALAPYMVPPIAGGIVWVWFLEPSFGFVNHVLDALGMQRIYFLVKGNLPFLSILTAQTWKDFGYASIIYLAALQQVPDELHESAMMDGAGPFARFRFITIPYLQTATLIILAIRTNWNVVEFGLPFEMLAGGPGTRTTFLSILLYKLGFVRLELGRAYVVGVAMILISLTAFFLYTNILRGGMGEEE